ncbi:uncharacterized protein RCO7_10865 [Rhynchosporium graminicola]|uniref:Uncharacterized protein n=1 Tax=Rhynchosporium graminicola TaxID=2792576 RepID=A0A1E1LBP7_9HELO|nr:uncharacterized protein RCO7_10865 [Rhynchosporium commune]
MDCLINLMILLVQVGLGSEGKQALVLLEYANRLVGPRDSESPRYQASSWFISDSDTPVSESEDSEYIDNEVEIDNKRVNHLDVSIRDIYTGESDKALDEDKAIRSSYESLSEIRSDEKESEYFSNSSFESEVEIDDKDIRGPIKKILDIDNNNISDFVL